MVWGVGLGKYRKTKLWISMWITGVRIEITRFMWWKITAV